MMNYMAQVATMLGVKLGEEFEINEIENSSCILTDDGLTSNCFVSLTKILRGNRTIKIKIKESEQK